MISFLSTAFLGFLRMSVGFLSIVLVFSVLYLLLSVDEVRWTSIVGVFFFASYKVGKY